MTNGIPSSGRRFVAAIEFLLQAIADFLIEDACALCGRVFTGHPTGEGPDPRRLLAGPVSRRWFAGLRISNHPLCGRCVADLETARRSGFLGVVRRDGSVWTARGGLFGRPALRQIPLQDGIDVHSPFMIEHNLLKIIHLYKFSGYDELAPTMAEAIVGFPDRLGESFDLVVPVPPRGSGGLPRPDHAGRLAASLSARLGVDCGLDVLEKARTTARQSTLSHELRADNVRGAYLCRRPAILRDRHVAVVDDLVTTGATAAACSAELLAGGARSVAVVCFARAI